MNNLLKQDIEFLIKWIESPSTSLEYNELCVKRKVKKVLHALVK